MRVAACLLAAFIAPLIADAQPLPNAPTIGFLSISPRDRVAHLLSAFEGELREQGYVEGRNIVFYRRFADGHPEQLPALAMDLVQRNVSVIVAYGATSARAAKNATITIPIVMMVHPDAVSAGLVASIAKPGGNVTGLARLSEQLSAKRIELLKDAVPKVSRIAILWYPGSPDGERSVHEAERAARQLGVQVQAFPVRSADELEAAFADMKHFGADGLFTVPSTVLFDEYPSIAALATKHRLPSIFPDSEFVEAGGLMSYGARLADEFKRAATYVASILRGAKPADMPVEQPTRLVLIINLKAAKMLGITVPQAIQLRADELVQ
jgi:putative ABC transport system substrate-binding protein